MKNKFLKRISDLTHIHHRAAFVDVKDRVAPKTSAFLALAKERYSCRSFAQKAVSDKDIEQILEAARVAPSAANKQPVHVWVVRQPESLAKLKEATQYLYNAPIAFVVGCSEAEAWVRKYDGKNGAEVDAAIVGTHIMLEAADLGLGCVWVGSFDPAKVLEQFPQMDGYQPVAIFPVGVPAGEPAENHGKRQTKEEFVTEL